MVYYMVTWTIERLLDLEPYEFEELLGHLFTKMGYRAEVTQRSRDAGVDINVSIENFGLSHTWIVQAKRYVEPVGVKEVREYSSLRYRDNVDGVIIATTSGFTKEAQKEALGHNVKLLDGPLLAKMLERYMPEDPDRRVQQCALSENRETWNIEGTVLKQGEKTLGETEVFFRGERVLMACTNKRIFLIKDTSSLLSKRREVLHSMEVKDLLGWTHETPSLYLVMGGRQITVLSMRARKPENATEMLECLQQGYIRGEHLLKFERTKDEFIVLTNKRIAKIHSSGGADEISLKNILGTEIKGGGLLNRSKLLLIGNRKENTLYEIDCADLASWKEAIEAAIRVS
ncbi:MAG: Restriction endonuclease [Methanomethylovorans sp. PtaU1.Bin093]|jgi:restriction system protein|nr:MAG: Restriction endonuclease [Methanomethylovorans sp. PtaU1.Bin093]